MKNNLLKSGISGRYGGDEFLIILPNTPMKDAHRVGERVRESIKNKQFTNGVRVTISVGIKEYNKEDINIFLDKADKALYRAKNRGRNRVVCFDSDLL